MSETTSLRLKPIYIDSIVLTVLEPLTSKNDLLFLDFVSIVALKYIFHNLIYTQDCDPFPTDLMNSIHSCDWSIGCHRSKCTLWKGDVFILEVLTWRRPNGLYVDVCQEVVTLSNALHIITKYIKKKKKTIVEF